MSETLTPRRAAWPPPTGPRPALSLPIHTVPDAVQDDQWTRNARTLALVGHPLTPAADDVARIVAALPNEAAEGMLLGLTPALLARLPQLRAVDRSAAMIALLPARGHQVVRADWQDLPFAGASLDIAVGDGSLSSLRYPDQYRAVVTELDRVLRPGGRIVLRVFSSPSLVPDCASVIADALSGSTTSFHAFKIRLAQALAAPPRSPNVVLAEVHAAFCAAVPDRAAFAHASGWPVRTIDTIDAYRDARATYSFPSRAALHALFASLGWQAVRIAAGTYQHADCYEVHAFARAGNETPACLGQGAWALSDDDCFR